MTKLMFDNLERLGTAHSAAKDIKLESATQNLPIPLHPGAERFYKAAGALSCREMCIRDRPMSL